MLDYILSDILNVPLLSLFSSEENFEIMFVFPMIVLLMASKQLYSSFFTLVS